MAFGTPIGFTADEDLWSFKRRRCKEFGMLCIRSFLQGNLTGHAWGNWALYAALQLRASQMKYYTCAGSSSRTAAASSCLRG